MVAYVPGAGEEAMVAYPWGKCGEDRASPHIYEKVLRLRNTLSSGG
jgi:hypothetical protein